MDESKIIKRLKAGEKEALNDLYTLYSRRIFGFSLGYLKQEEDAHDVVQEVFIRLWMTRENLSSDSKPEAYLFTLARNLVISTFRKRVSEKEYLENLRFLVVKNNSDTESQVDYALLSEKMKELIHSMPEQRQRVYLLSKESGRSNKSIAEELQISVKTVEDHITKARKFLKDHLREYGFLSIFL
ncbi:MAG: RNA polymerase sigma factor [Mangrovibacterium sp.]